MDADHQQLQPQASLLSVQQLQSTFGSRSPSPSLSLRSTSSSSSLQSQHQQQQQQQHAIHKSSSHASLSAPTPINPPSYVPYRSPRLAAANSQPTIDPSSSQCSRSPLSAGYPNISTPSVPLSPMFASADRSPARSEERDQLLSVLEALHRCEPVDLDTKLYLGGQLYRLLVEASHGGHARDDFREAGGFILVVQLLASLESTSSNQHSGSRLSNHGVDDGQVLSKMQQEPEQQQEPPPINDAEMHERLRIEIFKLALSILSESMLYHPLNQKAFHSSVGWNHLRSSIQLSTIGQTSPDHLFGSLFGLCLGDVSTYSVRIAALRRAIEANSDQFASSKDKAAFIDNRIFEQWSAPVVFPAAALLVLEIKDQLGSVDAELDTIVMGILERIATSAKSNQALLADAGMASKLLDMVLSDPALLVSSHSSLPPSSPTDTDQQSRIEQKRRIVQHLYTIGIPDTDGKRILRHLVHSPLPLQSNPLLDMLLDVAPRSRDPNTIHFTMAEYGHCSVAFSTLRRPFPPATNSRGFSFVTTFHMDRIEPSLPLELLQLFDAQRTISVQLTIEPGTGQLSYSTVNQTPPVRFKNFHFATGRRYHVVFIHVRPKGGANSSLAQLFVDGNLVEEKMALWPPSPPHLGSPVRAVIGSPPSAHSHHLSDQSRSENGKKRFNRLVWSLGPTWLLDDVLAPDFPLILYELGPRYSSNAQDSLGRFLTYHASARINLRLDAFVRSVATNGNNSGDKGLAHHPLVTAIAGKACELIQEERLYFVLNTGNTAQLDRIPRRQMTDPASGALTDGSIRSAPTVILNQALPLTKEAIGASYGVAKLYGEPVLILPKGVDEMVWRLGGCAVLLKLIQLSTTTEALAKTLSLFFQLVSNSWRLSEDIERSKGYEVLGALLSHKAHLFDAKIVDVLFRAVGFLPENPDQAVLINPFLYRIVMLDLQLWSQTHHDLQQTHLDHFRILLRSSKHRRFNTKRVVKMQIVKKLIYALRSRIYSHKISLSVIAALKAVLTSSFTDVSLRLVTSYLASELCQGPESSLAKSSPIRSTSLDTRMAQIRLIDLVPSSASSNSIKAISLDDREKNNDTMALPVCVFEMLSEMVFDRPNYLYRFAESVNIKWVLLFFHPRADRRAVALALELLAKLLLHPQLGYSEKLNANGGFKVLERLLPRFWSIPTVMSMLWSCFFGVEVESGPSLLQKFKPPSNRKERAIHCPPIMRTILSCTKEGIRSLAARLEEPRRQAYPGKPRSSDLLSPPLADTSKPRHARKRSQSMNVDIKSLQEAFNATTEISFLCESAQLINSYALTSNSFKDLLFSPIILRGLIDSVFMFSGERDDGPKDETNHQLMTSVIDIVNLLMDLLAKLSADSMLASKSTAILVALNVALPPTDLAQQTNFRTTLHQRIAAYLLQSLDSTPEVCKSAADALAIFVEKASEDLLTDCLLEKSLFQTVVRLLGLIPAGGNAKETHAVLSLFVSLNRIVLHRLTDDKSMASTFEEIIEHQTLLFHSINVDHTFFECLLNRILFQLKNKDGHVQFLAFSILKLMTLSRPAVIESILADGKSGPDVLGAELSSVSELMYSPQTSLTLCKGGSEAELPYQDSWEGFFKSRETLKAAAHLERLQQLHETLRRVDAREQAVVNTENRMVAWHASLVEAEQSRYAKFVNDVHEMSKFASIEWQKLLDGLERERAIFGPEHEEREIMWKLDATEGPDRIRLKLQPLPKQSKETDETPYRQEPTMDETLPSSPVDMVHGDAWGSGEVTGMTPAGAARKDGFNPDAQPVTAPTSTDGELQSARALQEESSADQAESCHEDKYRRVLRSLERGDIIEAVFNTSRVVGIECRGCLLILGKSCIYLMDDYFQRPNGELINVWEAPPEERDTLVMATLSSDASRPSDLIAQLEGVAQTRKWPWSAVQICHRRSWLHRRTAVEVFFEDGQSCLLVCRQSATAQKVYQELRLRAPSAVAAAETMREGIREAANSAGGSASSLGSRLAGAVLGRSQSSWGSITTAWREGRMSNFAYLMELNTLAGRSMNDLTQFPCFPWVLADYKSKELDLTNPETFRQFELPMGAQTPVRRKEFEDRYGQLVEVDMEPFHYGTHYSTAVTVCGFLIRLRPFERLLIALQGGTFDLADRTFGSIGKAWHSACELSRGDVRELVPEFFYLPEFLLNSNRFDFGITQAGEVIDDVELPPWAKGDPRLFILKHREALECEYVSQRLHHWIDLIFGYRSRGQEAIESTNVFHPLSYENAVDLDSIESSMERQATAQVIHNFGQTPSRLFSHPHPQRFKNQIPTLPIGDRFGLLEHPRLLIQSIAPIRTLKNAVHFIYPHHPERAFASPRDYLILPQLGVSLSTEHLDGSLRMFSSKDPKRPLAVIEQMTADRITCIAPARTKAFVAGQSDGNVSVWNIDVAKREIWLSNVFRGHSQTVLCVAASSVWSIAVSGSNDCTAIVWDLNRGNYVRSLRGHDTPVHAIAIDDKNGYIATAYGPAVRLWSINGDLLASVATSANILEPVSSLCFYERDYHVGRLAVLLTGHRGKVILWEVVSHHLSETVSSTRSSQLKNSSHELLKVPTTSHNVRKRSSNCNWKFHPFHILQHQDRIGSITKPLLITSIQTTDKMIFTGDELGRLFSWNLPGQHHQQTIENFSTNCCIKCNKRFGVLESRRSCSGCAGLFCNACVVTVYNFSLSSNRFCSFCHDIIDSAFS